MSTPWYDDFENVKALGNYLAFYKICAAQVLQAYYEQPANWQQEWDEMKAYELQEQRLASDEGGAR